MKNKLAIILPCFNEEEVLQTSIPTMTKFLNEFIAEKLVSSESQLVFIDDGSSDKTYEILTNAALKDKHIAVIKLSRNFGQQEALLAGLYNYDADVYITMDTDLQDPPSALREMLEKWHLGNEIVYAIRKSRKQDSALKKFTALAFYKVMNMLGAKTIYNHCNFRLMSRRVINELQKFPERNFFIRGIVPLIGFKSERVYHDRPARTAGKTKWSPFKLFALALDAITGFSTTPLRMITAFGLLISGVSFIIVAWTATSYFCGFNIKGWTSIIFIVSMFSGIIIFSLGLIGEYVGRILIEVKRRPIFILDETKNITDI